MEVRKEIGTILRNSGKHGRNKRMFSLEVKERINLKYFLKYGSIFGNRKARFTNERLPI